MADVSAERASVALLGEVEREVARLRRGMRPIDDVGIKGALGSGDAPPAVAGRLVSEAEARRAAGDCAGAVAGAREAEEAILQGVPVDDERDMLKTVYAVMVECEAKLGREAEARAAGHRLRHLVSLPPSGLDRALWDRLVPQAWPPKPTVELKVDSDPPNARVSVDFHGEGVTPRTLLVPPGTVYVELEKDGYKKAFRRVVVAAGVEARTTLRLTERSHDRVEQSRVIVAGLRGADPARRRSALSKLCQLARVDTLVVIAAAGGRVKIWFFDAERGDLTGEPIDSRFEASTGKVEKLSARETPAAPATAASAPAPAAEKPAPTDGGLPEAESRKKLVPYNPQPWRKPNDTVWDKWYAWVISAAVVAGVVLLIRLDQPEVRQTLDVRAHWNGPR